MEESTKSNNKFLLIGLAVLLIAVSIYTIYNNSEHKKLTNAIETEKNEIAVNKAADMEIYDIMTLAKDEEDAITNASSYLTQMARKLEI